MATEPTVSELLVSMFDVLPIQLQRAYIRENGTRHLLEPLMEANAWEEMDVRKTITFFELSTKDEVFKFLYEMQTKFMKHQHGFRMTEGITQIVTHRKVLQCLPLLYDDKDKVKLKLITIIHSPFFYMLRWGLGGNHPYHPLYDVVRTAIRRDANTPHAKYIWALMFLTVIPNRQFQPNEKFHFTRELLYDFVRSNVTLPTFVIVSMIRGIATPDNRYGYVMDDVFTLPYVEHLTRNGIVFPDLTSAVPSRRQGMSEERLRSINSRRKIYKQLHIKWDRTARKNRSTTPWVQYVLDVQNQEDRASQEIAQMRNAFDEFSESKEFDVYPNVQTLVAGYLRPELLERYPDYESRVRRFQRNMQRRREQEGSGGPSSKRRM